MRRNRRNISRASNASRDGRSRMEKGLTVVIGMSIAYVASLLGMFLAYFSYKKHKKDGTNTLKEGAEEE